MKQNRIFVATALVALLAAGACEACPVSPNLAGADAVTALKTDEGVPQNRVFIPKADGGVPNDRVSAARSAESSFEHREPPPKHLVAVRSSKYLELERPVAG